MAAINLVKRSFLKTAFAIALVSVPFASQANAEDYATAQTYIHSFTNNINVYSGVFSLNKDVSMDTSAYLKYSVDVIDSSGDDDDGTVVSGASSAATTGVSDTRNDINLGFTHNFKNIIGLEAYYDYSKETDYTSKTPTLTLKKELFDKNTTLSLGYSRNDDEISGKFLGSTQPRTTDNFFFGVTQVISPVTIAQIGYSRSNSRGQMSEGIRLVPLNGVAASTCTAESATCVDEAHPSSRYRDAYILGVNHYFLNSPYKFLEGSSVKFTLRYYNDSWDIESYMAEAEWNKYLNDRLLLRLDYRYYTQTAAYFVKDIYTASDEFKSSSPQLVSKDTQLAGVKLSYEFEEDESSGIRLGSIEGKYEAWAESTDVYAHIIMAALRFNY